MKKPEPLDLDAPTALFLALVLVCLAPVMLLGALYERIRKLK